jgi:hypothetical protein
MGDRMGFVAIAGGKDRKTAKKGKMINIGNRIEK